MARELKLFENHSQYESYISGSSTILPNVSYCWDDDEVHYNPLHEYSNDYLTTTALESGTIGFRYLGPVPTSQARYIEYSTDNGETWTRTNNVDNEVVNVTVNVSIGDKILWRGDNDSFSVYEYDPLSEWYEFFSGYFTSTCNFDVHGNIMSLLYEDDFRNQTTLSTQYSFVRLFTNCKIINAKNLIIPATTLSNVCYYEMFEFCQYLVTTPKLPATALTQNCYSSMFSYCTSLTTAPELPATTLATNCYDQMFYECTNLTTPPTSLPATTLAESCYQGMFQECTSLTTAPILPATALTANCYHQMFYGCTNLNYIKAMFTTTPSSNYTSSWVDGVAASGTFVKNSAATWNVTGTNGVPTGWTIQTATP